MEGTPLYLEAEIKIQEETAARKEKASQIITLPAESEKQPDLLYFSAIFVSSGENLNHAYFLGSELVAAEGTIINKALDVEHSEDEIIGHIYERAFMSKEGDPIDIKELASMETASLDNQELHIAIAGIIYKTRFPNVAQEVADNKWKVSMECYFQSHDVKIGDLILSAPEAEALGLASSDDSLLGRVAKVLKNGKEIASGQIARVLRNICFSGCGIVKNPANPPSIILETAKEKTTTVDDDGVIILDYDVLEQQEQSNENKVTSIKADDITLEETDGGVTLDQEEILRVAKATFELRAAKKVAKDRRKDLLDGLKAALSEAVKTQSR